MGREEIAIGPLRHCRCKRARRLHRWMWGSPWAIWPSFIRQRDRETVLWFVQTNASSSSPPWTSCDGEWKLLSRGRQSSRVLFPSCPLMSLSYDFPSSLSTPPFLSLSLSSFRFIRRRASSFRKSRDIEEEVKRKEPDDVYEWAVLRLCTVQLTAESGPRIRRLLPLRALSFQSRRK